MTTASPEFQAPTRAGSKTVFSLLATPSTEGKSPQLVSRAAKTGVTLNARIASLFRRCRHVLVKPPQHPVEPVANVLRIVEPVPFAGIQYELRLHPQRLQRVP